VLREDEALQSTAKTWEPSTKHLRLQFPAPKLRSRELQWDVAEYFFDFELGPNSLYERFCRRAQGAVAAGAVRLATLNYDGLLFSAMDRAGILYNVGQIGAAADSAWLCLPHGSSMLDCKAGITTEGASYAGKGGAVELNFGPLGVVSHGAIDIFSDIAALRARRARAQGPPSLCFIEPGKTTTSCVNVIENHQSLWRTWMAGVSRLVVIGARVAPSDHHIWDSAAAAVRRGVESFYVSGRSAQEFSEWCTSNGRPPKDPVRSWHWDEAFEQSCAFLGI
jgi:hypothetical protein